MIAMQPLVILGGFLSAASEYTSFRKALQAYSSQPVMVVQNRRFEWLLTVNRAACALLLDRLANAVKSARSLSPTGKVTLIGHSQGGVLARLYLAAEPFYGKTYAGQEWVDHLITLGSPHLNQGGLTRGGPLARWVNERWPGAACAPQVRYTCVAGKWMRGSLHGTHLPKMLYRVYESVCGDGVAWGDGVVPVVSALLPGSEQIILEGVCHYTAPGQVWYGSLQVIPQWVGRAGEGAGG